MDRYLRSPKPSSQMFVVLMSTTSDLLVTEGARRRVRVEIEHRQAKENASVSAIEDYKMKLDL